MTQGDKKCHPPGLSSDSSRTIWRNSRCSAAHTGARKHFTLCTSCTRISCGGYVCAHFSSLKFDLASTRTHCQNIPHTNTHTHTHTYDTGQRLRGMPSTDDVAECVLPLNACYPRRRISSLSPQDVLSRQRKKGEKTSMHYVDLAVIRGRRTQLYSRLPLRWCD